MEVHARFELRGKVYRRKLSELELYTLKVNGPRVLTPKIKRSFYDALQLQGVNLILSELKFLGYDYLN